MRRFSNSSLVHQLTTNKLNANWRPLVQSSHVVCSKMSPLTFIAVLPIRLQCSFSSRLYATYSADVSRRETEINPLPAGRRPESSDVSAHWFWALKNHKKMDKFNSNVTFFCYINVNKRQNDEFQHLLTCYYCVTNGDFLGSSFKPCRWIRLLFYSFNTFTMTSIIASFCNKSITNHLLPEWIKG